MRLAFVATLVLISTASVAAEPVRSPPVKDPDKMICETQEILGSRLGGRRVCKTRAQWDDSRQRDRQEIERGQRVQTNPTG